jgi:hypothetical protein
LDLASGVLAMLKELISTEWRTPTQELLVVGSRATNALLCPVDVMTHLTHMKRKLNCYSLKAEYASRYQSYTLILGMFVCLHNNFNETYFYSHVSLYAGFFQNKDIHFV